MRNKYTKKGTNYGCTNPDAFNFDPDATTNDGSCLLANDFIISGCPLNVHPADESDFSSNYVGDESLEGDNVFILTGNDETDEDVIGAARAYYEGGGTDLIIYSTLNCVWGETVTHQISSIMVQYENESGSWVTIGDLVDNLEFQMSSEITTKYEQDGGITLRITYNFNTDQEPTYKDDAAFSRFYEYNDEDVDEVSVVYNPYPSFEEDIVIDNSVVQLEDNATIKMEHKLDIPINEYPEIGKTPYDFTIKKFVEETPEFILGDMNGDGNLDVIDMTALANLILTGGATVETHPEADVDGDGNIDIQDLVALAELVTGGG